MYDVTLLVESQLEDIDADQVVALHEGLEDTVRYHLLMPIENSTATLTSSMSALGGGHVAAVPDPSLIEEMQDTVKESGQAALDASMALLRDRGQEATGQLVDTDPIDTLKALVAETASSEVIILTETHFLKEFFHIDWSSRAKRVLDVPTLHLIERYPIESQG
ncbi:hypothetical protein [Aeromicrobium sp. CF3.5]|uniref:hypothetical protein n=1 Tax=Aeromicrobium sp. CF3.5 TaxID=3373078 RepID=UPI003EE613A5